MSRCVGTVAFLSLTLPFAVPAAPAPEPVAGTLFYPTTVGTKWVYWDGEGHIHFTISRVVEKDGQKFITVEQVLTSGRRWAAEVIGVSEKGLVQTQAGSRQLDPPLYLLKLPCRKGDRWQVTPKAPETTTTAYPEQVRVPAGEFTAIRVETTERGETPGNRARWFAPGVGTIKWRYNVNGKTRERLLTSFTPA